MKKQTWVAILVILIVDILGIGIGVKVHMDRVEINQEREITVQAKKMFRDIEKIKILSRGEASPGSPFFIIEITNNKKNVYKVELDLGDAETYSTVQNNTDFKIQMGETITKIQVTHLSGERENV
ncbi:hypothetical protein GKC32_06025 [Lactobacillus curvatus]|nr:hypothetical protein [Latilactobacillus curvatus]MSE24026.1 hypothetical protein [Latilactobacillus curvatus]